MEWILEQKRIIEILWIKKLKHFFRINKQL